MREGTLSSKTTASSSEVVYIHAGFGDLLDKTEGDDLIDQFKQLINKLLEDIKARVCISTMIPVPGYPQFNSKLRQINTKVSDFISELGKQQKYRNRVLTNINDSLGGYINRKTCPGRTSISLSKRGQKLLLLGVKDGLQRSLGITQRRPRSENDTITRNHTDHE